MLKKVLWQGTKRQRERKIVITKKTVEVGSQRPGIVGVQDFR
jgi:hypothetical protein